MLDGCSVDFKKLRAGECNSLNYKINYAALLFFFFQKTKGGEC